MRSASTAPPPRAGWVDRIRHQAGYRWRNGGARPIRLARTIWDTPRGSCLPAIRSTVGNFTITYAGLTEGVPYALEFTEQRREEALGLTSTRENTTVNIPDLQGIPGDADEDIVIIGTNDAKARRLPCGASFVMPIRVHFAIDLNDDLATVLSRASRGERRNFRQKSRQRDWRLDICTDHEIFDWFYDRMYRSTMRERHGERERIEEREAAYECLFRSGQLFFLSMNGERVAGHLCHYDPSTRVLTSRLIGVLDGSAEHYQAGAIKAMHFLLIEWAHSHGYSQIDLQGTEAFVSKSTFQFKRLFGTRVILPPNHFGDKRLWVSVRRDTDAVRDFLAANPVLTETAGGELESTYFFDRTRPARRDIRGDAPGVARTRELDLDEFLAGPT